MTPSKAKEESSSSDLVPDKKEQSQQLGESGRSEQSVEVNGRKRSSSSSSSSSDSSKEIRGGGESVTEMPVGSFDGGGESSEGWFV